MKRITEGLPTPGGHYTPGMEHGGLIYVSGQLPIIPGQKPGNPPDIEAQTRQALANFLSVVKAGGGDADTVLKVTIFIANGDDWGIVNKVFAEVFGEHRPARAIVPVSPLHYGYGIEVDGVAFVKKTDAVP